MREISDGDLGNEAATRYRSHVQRIAFGWTTETSRSPLLQTGLPAAGCEPVEENER